MRIIMYATIAIIMGSACSSRSTPDEDDDSISDDDDSTLTLCDDYSIPVTSTINTAKRMCIMVDDSLVELQAGEIENPTGINPYTWLFFPYDEELDTGVSLENIEVESVYLLTRVKPEESIMEIHIRYRVTSPNQYIGSITIRDDDFVYDSTSHVFSFVNLFASRTNLNTLVIQHVNYAPYWYTVTTVENPGISLLFTYIELSSEIGWNPFN